MSRNRHNLLLLDMLSEVRNGSIKIHTEINFRIICKLFNFNSMYLLKVRSGFQDTEIMLQFNPKSNVDVYNGFP